MKKIKQEKTTTKKIKEKKENKKNEKIKEKIREEKTEKSKVSTKRTNKKIKKEKAEKTTKTKQIEEEKTVSFAKLLLILLIDYTIISLLSLKIMMYVDNLIITQKSYTQIFFYINILGIIAYFYALFFLKTYNSTIGMMLLKTKINNNNIKNIAKYSLLYYSIYLSSIIVIIELISKIILKNTTMFEIISNTKLVEKQ